MRASALPRLLLILAIVQPQAFGASKTTKDGLGLPGSERPGGATRRSADEPVREIRDIAAPLEESASEEQRLETGDTEKALSAAPVAPGGATSDAVSPSNRRAGPGEAADAETGQGSPQGSRSAVPKVDFDGRGIKGSQETGEGEDHGDVDVAGDRVSRELLDLTFNRKLQQPPRVPGNMEAAPKPPAKKDKKDAKDSRYSNPIRDGLKESKIYKAIRLLATSSKEWYWSNRFKAGARVRVLMGNRTVFVSEIEDAKTKRIQDVTKKDLEGTGYFDPKELSRAKLPTLRERLKAKLAEYGDKVTGASLVRLMHILPFGKAKELEINKKREVAAKIGPRNPVSVPDSLKSLHAYLPKLILLDLRLFPNGVPLGLVDDMGKLLKAGVHFSLITDKPGRGPGSIQEQLGWGLGDEENDQHDKLVRYKLSVLADGGNTIMAYKGNFLEDLPSSRFGQLDMDLMKLAAHKVGAVEIEARKGDRLVLTLPEGADTVGFIDAYKHNLAQVGIFRYHLESAFISGKTQLIVRPSNLSEGLEKLMTGLQDHSGLYVDNEDMFVISKDPEVLGATRGAVHAAKHMPGLDGVELAETSLAAVLGGYREMGPADLAASASMIKGVKQDKEKYFNKTSDEETVEILIGHVIHSAFNWAIKLKRDTGALPPIERVLDEANRRWERSYAAEEKNLLRNPGDSIADARMTMNTRLETMYKNVDDILRKFPIIFATEMPRLTIMQRHAKGGAPLYRNFIRSTFDVVLGRETPQGLEVLYLDLKSGKTHDQYEVKKDFQYLLYDYIARRVKELPVPYNVEGAMKKVSKASVGFLYPQRLVVPELTEDDRTTFAVKTLPGDFDRLRKSFQMEIPKGIPPKAEKLPKVKRTAASRTLIPEDLPAWDAMGSEDKTVFYGYVDRTALDAAVSRAVAKGKTGEKLFKDPYLSRLAKGTFEAFDAAAVKLKKRSDVRTNWTYFFTESGSSMFIEIQGTKSEIETLAKTVPIVKAWLGRPGESDLKNQLFMANPQAFQNAENGVSTYYLRRGTGFGYQKEAPGHILTKGPDGEKILPVWFQSVEEMPYEEVGPKILNGLAPGETWEGMLAQMQKYYPSKPEKNDPGFMPTDKVTVIRYRRR